MNIATIKIRLKIVFNRPQLYRDPTYRFLNTSQLLEHQRLVSPYLAGNSVPLAKCRVPNRECRFVEVRILKSCRFAFLVTDTQTGCRDASEPQRDAKSALKPSTMVGWESTASRSVVAGIFAIITACTVPIISPASAAMIVQPRIR